MPTKKEATHDLPSLWLLVELLLPQLRHLLQRLALRFGYPLPDEDGRGERHECIDAVGAAYTPRRERGEGGRDEEVGNPLRCHGNGHSLRTDRVGEDLRDEYPADRTPAEHE